MSYLERKELDQRGAIEYILERGNTLIGVYLGCRKTPHAGGGWKFPQAIFSNWDYGGEWVWLRCTPLLDNALFDSGANVGDLVYLTWWGHPRGFYIRVKDG